MVGVDENGCVGIDWGIIGVFEIFVILFEGCVLDYVGGLIIEDDYDWIVVFICRC